MTLEAWDSLYAVLLRVAPRTAESVAQPAPTAVIDSAVAATAVEWPDELLDFYRVQNGQRPGDAPVGEIVPLQRVLSVQALARRHGERARPAASADKSLATRQRAEGWFPASHIPIAESEDSITIYDTAAPVGADKIRRYRFDGTDTDFGGWASIAAMLNTLAKCLLSLEPLSSDLAPYVTHGVLLWGPIDTNYFRARDESFQRPFLAPDLASASGQAIEPVPIAPTANGVDLMAVQRQLLKLAAERYGASHITQVGVSSFHLPRVPGSQIGCFVAVDGVLKGYRARALDEAGKFIVEPDS